MLFAFLTSKCPWPHKGVHLFAILTSKNVPRPPVFNTLTSKFALRQNTVHFLDISTSKSAPNVVCFARFDLEMCFRPQRRALFEHINFQKRSDRCVLHVFILGHVLRATSPCIFSTSQLPKVLRTCGAFSFFTCHKWLRTRRFSEPTF